MPLSGGGEGMEIMVTEINPSLSVLTPAIRLGKMKILILLKVIGLPKMQLPISRYPSRDQQDELEHTGFILEGFGISQNA